MVEKITDLDTVLKMTHEIGQIKKFLDFKLRGYVNVGGLYIQLAEFGGQFKLEAGGKYRSCLEARGSRSTHTSNREMAARAEDIAWDVKKFDSRTWEQRFAHLLGPTFEIGHALGRYVMNVTGQSYDQWQTSTQIVQRAVERFEKTGEWVGVEKVECINCEDRIPFWRTLWRNEQCTVCYSKT